MGAMLFLYEIYHCTAPQTMQQPPHDSDQLLSDHAFFYHLTASHRARGPALSLFRHQLLFGQCALQEIARTLQRSPAQVALRWALQRGMVVIPRATGRKHLEENLDVHSMRLSDDQMAVLDALDGGMAH